jgi:hypothetical protein
VNTAGTRLCAVWMIGALFGCADASRQAEPHAAAAAPVARPIALSADQLDTVSAGMLTMQPQLTAIASGTTAVAEDELVARIVPVEILAVSLAPNRQGVSSATSVRAEGASLGTAFGQATASGSAGAQCTAGITVLGASFTQKLDVTVATPTAASCICSVLSVAPLR